ncbi:odorant receptor 131-2-like [Gastrophryne carolinensis]
MANSSNIPTNLTQLSISNEIRMTSMLPVFFCFSIFLFFMAAMLTTFFTSQVARETARYILFAHMLINDTVYLALGLFLFYFPNTLPVPFCYLIVTISSVSLKVTPYNLAVMSLERYIAILLPLRHGEFCTIQRTCLMILLIWTIGLIPNVVDFIIMCLSVDKSFFLLYVQCHRGAFIINPVQDSIRVFVNAFTFSMVGLIIILTYIRIMMVAMKITLGRAFATKAGKTVMLHAIQLLLCMTAFSYGIIELFIKNNTVLLAVINFCFFMCLPRFLSPMIYGIRDELFRSVLGKYLCCNTFKTAPE